MKETPACDVFPTCYFDPNFFATLNALVFFLILYIDILRSLISHDK